MIHSSLVPSPLRRERKGSEQMCIEPVSPMQPRVRANQIRVLQSNDVKNAINSHCTRLCELKSRSQSWCSKLKTNRAELTQLTLVGDDQTRYWVVCNWPSRLNFAPASGGGCNFCCLIFLIFLDNVLYLVVLLDINSSRCSLCSVGCKANGMTRIPTDSLINAHRNFNYCIPRQCGRYTRLSRPLPLSAKGAGHETRSTHGQIEW